MQRRKENGFRKADRRRFPAAEERTRRLTTTPERIPQMQWRQPALHVARNAPGVFEISTKSLSRLEGRPPRLLPLFAHQTRRWMRVKALPRSGPARSIRRQRKTLLPPQR